MQSPIGSVISIVLIFVVFYFFLFRPQLKRQKERNQMQRNLKKGDRVVTIGGLHGSIVEIGDEKVTLKVNDSTRLTFERSAVNATVSDEENQIVKNEAEVEK